MNVGVEIALIAVPIPGLAIIRDVWTRSRVERKEALDRLDRIEKERLDRQQSADIAVIATVPAFLSLGDEAMSRELAAEMEKCRSLEKVIEQMKLTEISLREAIAAKETIAAIGTNLPHVPHKGELI